MRLISTISAVLFFASFYFSQNKKQEAIDRLKGQLSDSARCFWLDAYIEEETDNTVWPALNSELKGIAENRLKHEKNKALRAYFLRHYSSALVNEGYLDQMKNRLQESLNKYKKALDIKLDIKDRKGISTVLINIGYLYMEIADYEKAVDHFNRAFNIQEETGDKDGAAITLINLANLAIRQKDTATFLRMTEKALALRKEIKDERGIARCYNGLAVVEAAKSNKEKAIDLLKAAEEINIRINERDGLANTFLNLGRVYQRLKQFDRAKYYLEQSLKICLETNDKRSASGAYENLASIAYVSGNYKEAAGLYKKGYDFAVDCGDLKELANNSAGLSNAYTRLGNMSEAKEYKDISDSIEKRYSRKATVILSEPDFGPDSLLLLELKHEGSGGLVQEENNGLFLVIGSIVCVIIILSLVFIFKMRKR